MFLFPRRGQKSTYRAPHCVKKSMGPRSDLQLAHLSAVTMGAAVLYGRVSGYPLSSLSLCSVSRRNRSSGLTGSSESRRDSVSDCDLLRLCLG